MCNGSIEYIIVSFALCHVSSNSYLPSIDHQLIEISVLCEVRQQGTFVTEVRVPRNF